MACVRILLVLILLVLAVSSWRAVLPHAPASTAYGAPRLRLRGGSGDELRAQVDSLEAVLHKSVELTRILAEIGARREDAGPNPTEAADAGRSYLKARVLPLFATAV